MDNSLMDTCRYTGVLKTAKNADEFETCPKCGGITNKKALEEGRETRCSYCGETL